MTYAIYRCLYGEDFIQESINSITDYVDKIFIFWDDKAWADIDHCIYRGEKIIFPQQFDNILEKIKALNNPKVILVHDHVYNNMNQFTHFVNDLILPNYDKPDTVMVIEVDHVFRKDQIEHTLENFNYIRKQSNTSYFNIRQLEIWKGFKHRIPERNRASVVLWDMNKHNLMPGTSRHAHPIGPLKNERLSGFVHNYGFAVSEKVMYWKHMTALGYSQKIGDSPPSEYWFENVWKAWDFKENNKNLEISAGSAHTVPYAVPYDVSGHPEEIYNKYIIKK